MMRLNVKKNALLSGVSHRAMALRLVHLNALSDLFGKLTPSDRLHGDELRRIL